MDDGTAKWEKAAEAQIRFIELLRALTIAGRTEWLQAGHDPGFVYCLVDKEDLVEFQCSGGSKGDTLVPPSEPLAGVTSDYCNTTYLWLDGLASWETLVSLLRSARVDDGRFIECRRIAHWRPVRVLEERLRR